MRSQLLTCRLNTFVRPRFDAASTPDLIDNWTFNAELVLRSCKLERTRLTFHPNWRMQNFGLRNDRWVQRGLTPCDLQRQFRIVNDTPITTIATQVVIGPHENAIHGTRLYAQGTKHALCVVDRKAIDSEPFSDRAFFFVDINAVNRTSGCALFAANACGQVKTVETAIARLHLQRHFRILVDLGKCPSIICLEHRQERDVHPLQDGHNRHPDVAEPQKHGNQPPVAALRIAL